MSKKQKRTLCRIIISLVMLAVLLTVKFDFPYAGFLYFVPYLIIGYDVLKKAFLNIIKGKIFDECFLMAVASLGAFLIGETAEAAAVMIFYQTGEFFQNIAVSKSRRSIKELMDICPDTACVIMGKEEVITDADKIKAGEIMVVKPGERVAADGIITKGESSLDTSSLTGESLPLYVKKGDTVLSGSINTNGVIYVKVINEYKDSTAKKIVDLIEKAGNNKAKAENFITSFAKVYTPFVVISAAVLFALNFIFGGEFSQSLEKALMFLVVSCPCALVISVPLSFFGGIGSAAKNGILFKGSEYFEALSKLKTVIFDKTGTLTKGVFEVTAVHPAEISKDELLDIAALAESHSTHPIACSVIKAHKGHIDKTRIGALSEIAGMGIEAVIDGKKIFAGNEKLMEKEGIPFKKCHRSGTVIHIGGENEYFGHIVISDKIKDEAKEAINTLKTRFGINTVMLTGDNESVAKEVSEKVGADRFFAKLLPQDKIKITEEIKMTASPVAFVGDGINDAPVIKASDVGFAMGALGSDAAIEAADVVITDDSLLKIPISVAIAGKTVKIAKQNIVFSLFVKAAVLILAASGLLGKTGVGMWVAVFADVGVMIIAILNALRTLNFRIK